jgi:hypothetical protein
MTGESLREWPRESMGIVLAPGTAPALRLPQSDRLNCGIPAAFERKKGEWIPPRPFHEVFRADFRKVF